jgi:hypothetical protein
MWYKDVSDECLLGGIGWEAEGRKVVVVVFVFVEGARRAAFIQKFT